MSKQEKIRESLQRTRERRASQRPVVYQLKLQNLSRSKEKLPHRAFAEAKWLYNWLIADTARLSLPANKIHEVDVKVGSAFEKRKLEVLGSQVKQEIADRIKDNFRSLSRMKENGHRVGRLRFKSFLNALPLKQYGVTYRLSGNRVRVQRLGEFRVLGTHQIPQNAEIAHAVLVRKPSGFYLHVSCYLPRTDNREREKIDKWVGIDFGIGNKLALTNGMALDFEVSESECLKRLHRRLARKKPDSNDRERLRHTLRREYEGLNNRRWDAQNKVLAFLRMYRGVVFQEDSIRGWSTRFGRQVHSSGIGELRSRLRTCLGTAISVERYEPTTGECFRCGNRESLSLSDRIFRCSRCGWTSHRDLNAALVILRKGLGLNPEQALGLDRPKVTPLESEASARILGSNPYIRVSLLDERGSPSS